MPKDEAQLFAADELYVFSLPYSLIICFLRSLELRLLSLIACSYERGWFYHKELRLWFFRVGEPLVRAATYERGTYEYLDPNSFKTVRKVSQRLLQGYRFPFFLNLQYF